MRACRHLLLLGEGSWDVEAVSGAHTARLSCIAVCVEWPVRGGGCRCRCSWCVRHHRNGASIAADRWEALRTHPGCEERGWMHRCWVLWSCICAPLEGCGTAFPPGTLSCLMLTAAFDRAVQYCQLPAGYSCQLPRRATGTSSAASADEGGAAAAVPAAGVSPLAGSLAAESAAAGGPAPVASAGCSKRAARPPASRRHASSKLQAVSCGHSGWLVVAAAGRCSFSSFSAMPLLMAICREQSKEGRRAGSPPWPAERRQPDRNACAGTAALPPRPRTSSLAAS